MAYTEGHIGLISDINAQETEVKVTIYGFNDFTTGWVPLLLIPGTFYSPAVKDQVLVFMDEHFDTGVVLGGVYNPPVASEPDVIALKFEGIELQINKKTGETAIKLTGKAVLEAEAFELTGDLKVTGNLSVQGDATTSGAFTATGVIKSNADVKSPTVSLNTHMHPTAAPGSPSPPTPVPQ